MLTVGTIPWLSFTKACIAKNRSFPKEHFSEEQLRDWEGTGDGWGRGCPEGACDHFRCKHVHMQLGKVILGTFFVLFIGTLRFGALSKDYDLHVMLVLYWG